MFETHKEERALLILVSAREQENSWPIEDQKDEFKNLVLSTGIRVEDLIVVKRKNFTPGLYIGKGKAFELAQRVQELDVDVVIFDNNLTFTQQRDLEDVLGVKTIDRTQLILEIFAHHAHTQEGALQVELAQLNYLLPRLKGKGIVLSRLGGGIGTRGPGEKKLEVDKRQISDRIVRLKKALEKVRGHRDTQRKKRRKEGIAACSLVGYTNAGKSTLLNALTDAGQKTSNSFFTTLDPISRSISLLSHTEVIISDTVGFIYKLPPNLIEAFKATLEELYYTDILLHIVDASNKNYKKLITVVNSILKELNLEEKSEILVFNKIDRVREEEVSRLELLYPEAVFISSLRKTNLNSLIDKIAHILVVNTKQVIIKFPFDKMKILDYLYKISNVLKVEYTPDKVVALVKIKTNLLPSLREEDVEVKEI